MANLPKQIIGSFEDIGRDIGQEIAKLPSDIAGKALESLGTAGSGQKGQSGAQLVGQADATPRSRDNWDSIDEKQSQTNKQAVARAALQALVSRQKPKSKSVWELMQEEEAGKKEELAQKQAAAASQALPQAAAKRPRGDLYGMKAKKASAEMSRNVRQD